MWPNQNQQMLMNQFGGGGGGNIGQGYWGPDYSQAAGQYLLNQQNSAMNDPFGYSVGQAWAGMGNMNQGLQNAFGFTNALGSENLRAAFEPMAQVESAGINAQSAVTQAALNQAGASKRFGEISNQFNPLLNTLVSGLKGFGGSSGGFGGPTGFQGFNNTASGAGVAGHA